MYPNNMNYRKSVAFSVVVTMGLLSSCGGVSTLSRQEACVAIAKELQNFFNTPSSFADSANALSLGLGVLKINLDEEIGKDVTDYQDLVDKVDYTTRTNDDFLALVEQKHVDALNGLKSKCSAEGITIG
jgi:hypothetical protein